MARNTISLRGYALHEEAGIASGVVTPGDLLEFTGTGNQVRRHSDPGGVVTPLAFARENWENGGNGIGDNIPSGGEVVYILPAAGDKINARTAETIARGDELTSAGNGTLRVRAAGEALVGVADGPDDNGRVATIIGGAAPSESA